MEAEDALALLLEVLAHRERANMQHLNIPLSRHTKTTRRNRQVVWLMALVIIIGAFCAFRLGTMWLSRSTILSLAPSDTVLVLELHLNKSTAHFLGKWLSGVPLISNRSLELSDVSPYTKGELALFVTKSGERSVALRATKTDLPLDLLNNYGISTQEKGAFILLSSTLIPISGTKPFVHRPLLPSLGKAWLGRVVLPDSSLGGNLFLSQSEMTLEIDSRKRTPTSSQSLETASLVLGGLSWGENGSPLVGLERLSKNSVFLAKNSQMEAVVRSKEGNHETLLIIKNTPIDKEVVLEELERIGAFARPTLMTQTLIDGTKFEELLVQPELVSVEEISTALGTSYRVPTWGGTSISAVLRDGDAFFTTSQALLDDFVQNQEEAPNSHCPSGNAKLNPQFLLEQTNIDHVSSWFGSIESIFDDFSLISIEFKKYSTNLHLCLI